MSSAPFAFLLFLRRRRKKKIPIAAILKSRTAATMIPTNAPVDIDFDLVCSIVIFGDVPVVFADAMLMICEGAASIHTFWATEKLEYS